MREHLGRKLPAYCWIDPAAPQHLQDYRIVGRVHHRQNELVILGGGAKHRRSADIDILDGILERCASPRNRYLERIEIDRHQIDRHDLALAEGGHMLRQISSAQQGCVDQRVQGLDPPIEDLGEAGNLLHLQHRDVGGPQGGSRSAGGDDLPSELHQPLGEGHHPALVTDGDQRSWHARSESRV